MGRGELQLAILIEMMRREGFELMVGKPEIFRLTGSSDLYRSNGRQPYASVNFVTAHDGFTLHDLVSYNDKHNDANGEGNADGDGQNRSWNCGVEGPTDDPAIGELRNRQKRNFLASLLLSQGVPMLLAGDELGRTQRGNNNTYCQDNEVSWTNWSVVDRDLLAYTTALVWLRRRHPVLRRRRFFEGRSVNGSGLPDLEWFTPEGQIMSDESWSTPPMLSLMVFLNGEGITELGPRGELVVDESFLLCLHSGADPLDFTLPDDRWAAAWSVALDTRSWSVEPGRVVKAGDGLRLLGRSLVLLRRS